MIVAVLAGPAAAWARSEREYPYDYERVFPASVRFFRLDEKLKIVEKDADAGYLVFELGERGKTFQGSVEYLKATDRRGRKVTRLILRIDERPAYVEEGMLERFEQKLRGELGPPPAPPPPPPPAPPRGKSDGAKKKP